ncbi:MAG: heavy metal-binding domain-containing protein [Acidimicrobiaceae bacterium]|nr:heavy metal-binding domain-containing protein [Acidimicrobiaceae bacterium]
MSIVDPGGGGAGGPGVGGAGAQGDLPEAATRRAGYSAFTSGLTVQELAACEHMGMRPVALVQGFCVMGWNFSYSSMGGGFGAFGNLYRGNTLSDYRCPHPWVTDAEHHQYGFNTECTDMEAAWGDGYNRAYQRLIEEAKEFGAHGVIGITDATKSLLGSGVREFHLYGTAVVFENADPPKNIWSTYLAGQRLAKLFEAGLLPVSIIASIASVSIYPVCVTEVLESGGWDNYITPGSEITQLSDAHTSARQLARDNLKSRLGNDELHGADLTVHEYRTFGLEVISAELRGTRVRRFRDVEPLPSPVPTVRMVG